MDSLADVVAILRYESRQDLSALLTDAYLDFEYLDTGFAMTSDAEVHLVNAALDCFVAANDERNRRRQVQ